MSKAIENLTVWWNGRSPREQVLLSIMLVLVALTALWYGAIQPLRGGIETAAAVRAESAVQLAEARAVAGRIEAQQQKRGARRTPAALEERP